MKKMVSGRVYMRVGGEQTAFARRFLRKASVRTTDLFLVSRVYIRGRKYNYL